VNHTIRPFRVNVGFLINQPAGFQREIPFEHESYVLDEDCPMENLRGTITLARTLNGVRSLSDVHAKHTVECGKCLDQFALSIHSEFEEIFTFTNRPLSEEEAIIPEDGNIDFEPIIREYLLLEIPFTPVCKPDCKGLCSVCGKNLNKKSCEHQEANLETDNETPFFNLKQLSSR